MFKKILLIVAVLLPMSAFAQKFAVVDAQSIFSAMPETAAAETQIQSSAKQYGEEIQKLQAEVEKLVGEYQAIAEDPNTPQSIKERRMAEVQEKAAKVEQFRAQAEQDMMRQRDQILAPIQTKLTDAIKAVGQEGAYTFVIGKEDGLLFYIGSDVTDITQAVKDKLGI